MNVRNKLAPFILFVGDVIIFIASLWISLFLRYGGRFTTDIFVNHLVPFLFIFIIWFLVYYIAGLYESYTSLIQRRLVRTIFNAQIFNSLIAISFFYLIPYFGITPKTNLFIYLIVTWTLMLLWRMYGSFIFGARHREKALLISSGNEMIVLRDEVNTNPHYNLNFISSVNLDNVDSIDFNEEILKRIYSEDVSVIAIDFNNEKVEPILAHLYNLIFSKVIFVDMHKIYEDVFSRVPLSLLQYSWFLENISLVPKISYDFLKRVMDVAVALPLAIFVTIVVYPLVFIAMLFDEGKGMFSTQERVGQNNAPIKLFKFRTMKIANDNGEWGGENKNKVTALGEFLRKTRIDELPQLWNVVKGDVSLIGPRPEFFAAVKDYEEQIPYYNVRHLIKPGLSGWAQIYHENHPHHGEATHGTAVDATKEKLSYDLYYIKNRSFFLDIKIALKTIKELLSRKGK